MAKVSLQVIMVALVLNLKRLVKLLLQGAAPQAGLGRLRRGEVCRKEAEKLEKGAKTGAQGANSPPFWPRGDSMPEAERIFVVLIFSAA